MQTELKAIPVGMRPGRREMNSASLSVNYCMAVPERMRARTRELTHMFVPAEDRRRHWATALLNFVCQEADANGFVLLLTATPSEPMDDDVDEGLDGPDEEQLVDWYQKFGFLRLQQTPKGTIMARQPRVPASVIVGRAIHKAMHS